MINIPYLISTYNFDNKLREIYTLHGSAAIAEAITDYIQDVSAEDYGIAVMYARDFLIGSDLEKKEKKEVLR